MTTQAHFARFQLTTISDWLGSLDPDPSQVEDEERLEALMGDGLGAFEQAEALLREDLPVFRLLDALLGEDWLPADETDPFETDGLAPARGRPPGRRYARHGGRA